MSLVRHLLARSILGNQALRGLPSIVAQSAVQVSHTGNSNEVALATVSLGAGIMGTSGILLIEPCWTHTVSINNKTLRVRVGGIAGTIIFSKVNGATIAASAPLIVLANRNAQNSQIVPYSPAGQYYSENASAPATHAIDMALAQDLVITGQLASSGETVRLESYQVSLLKP